MTTTPQAVRRASPRTRRTATPAAPDPSAGLLPQREPVRLLDPDGTPLPARADYPEPPVEALREMYRRMVVGRRFDTQATALTKQGRLAVYPSARGQEACQVGARARAARHRLGLPHLPRVDGAGRPGHRPGRGAHAAARRLALRVRPDRDPHRAAVHPAGHPVRARRRPGLRRVVPGARHRGAGVHRRRRHQRGRLPRGASTSPPCSRRRWSSSCRTTSTRSASRCPGRPPRRSLAYKGVGYGVPSEQVDGNDPVAVLAVLHPRRRARPRRQRAVPRRGAHLPDGGAHQRRRRQPATATPTRSTRGATATRSPGSRRTCGPGACSTTRPSRRSPSRPRSTPRTCATG